MKLLVTLCFVTTLICLCNALIKYVTMVLDIRGYIRCALLLPCDLTLYYSKDMFLDENANTLCVLSYRGQVVQE